VLSLAASVMVAFGVILYGFSIFVTDAAAGSEFSKTVLSLGYGGSVVAGGLLAIPIGRRADRAGVRGITALGGVLGGCGMAIFALAAEPWQVLISWWFFLGPAGAMLFYEVTFIAVDQWFAPEQRGRALGVVTLIGGLAGIGFIRPGSVFLLCGCLGNLFVLLFLGYELGDFCALTHAVSDVVQLGPSHPAPSTDFDLLDAR
jgi:MFS family permease